MADNGKMYLGIGLDNEQLRADAKESQKIIRGIGDSASKEGSKIDSTFRSIGSAVATAFSVAAASAFVKNIVKIRGEVEALEISFKTLAGDAKGGALFSQIRKFAAETPMMMQDLAKGAQMLLSFNVEAEDVMPILKQIGDISMGDAQKFNSLTLAFSQMSSTGKLMGQDLLQMINAGFNPLSIIAEKTGKNIAELKDEMAKGAITSKMVADAFATATSEGGKFNGMLEKQSKGINGSISNLKGAIEDALNEIGETNQDIISGVISNATSVVKNYEKVGEAIAVIISLYGSYKAAVIACNIVEKIRYQATLAQMAGYTKMGAIMSVLRTKQAALNATMMKNPYALITAAVVALGYGIYKLATYQTESEKAQRKLNDSIKDADKSLQSELYQVNLMFSRLKAAKEGTEEYKDAKQAIISQYGEYLKKLGDEETALNDVAAAYALITEEATKASNARSIQAVTQEAGNIVSDKQSNVYDKVKEIFKKELYGKKGSGGITLADEYLIKLKPVIMDGAEITSDIQAIISQFDEEKTVYVENSDPIIYTKNVIKEQLASLNKIKRTAEQAVKDVTDKFGGNATSEEVEKKAPFDATTASLQQLMDILPKAMEELEALKNAERPDPAAISAKQKEIQQIREQTIARENDLKIIKDVKAQISLLSSEQEKYAKDDAEYGNIGKRIQALKSKLPTGEREEAVSADAGEGYAERERRIQEYTAAVAKQVEQSEMEIAQARIDAMDDGVEKEMARNEMSYTRMINANIQREKEMVEALRDVREMQWEGDNNNAGKGKFDRSTVTAADLTPDQRASITEFYKVAEEIRGKANKESLEKILAEVKTYEQERMAIAESYSKKREQLYEHDAEGKRTGLKEGVSQENVDNLNSNEQGALEAIDNEFAAKEVQFQSWMESIGNMALSQLRKTLADAEKELAELEKSGKGNSKQLAVARAKVSQAKKKVEKASADNEVSPDKRSIKEWEDLYSALREVEGEFESIGDTVGGVAGDIIKVAGQVMSSTLSMINGIVQLVNMSSEGMKITATGAAAAIATVEKASVILTVISAAIQIAMAIVNMFNKDEDKQKEIDSLQNRIDQLQWELDNAEAVRLQGNAFNILDKMRQTYAETAQEVLNLQDVSNRYASTMHMFYNISIKKNEVLIKTAEKLATAYANIAYTADKALGEERFDVAKDQLKGIAEQQLLIQEQINLENTEKDPDNSKIKEYEQKIIELGVEANEIINGLVEDIIGGSSTDIANDLADAFFEAFQAGEDYAAAWGDKVKEIVADVVKRMLISKYLEEPLGKIFDKYKNQWYNDEGGFVGIDAVISSMSGFANDLNLVGDDFKAIWDALPDSVKNMMTITDAAREGSQKGIATASQESVDENNGRLTAIQGHTYSIVESTKQLVNNSAMILDVLMGIGENTRNLSRLSAIEDNIASVKNTMNDIALKGVKLK